MNEITLNGPEAGALETESLVVRTLQASDLEPIVEIDHLITGRRRPKYFDLIVRRVVEQPGLQVSLMAELEGVPVGYLIATLYYGEYGVLEPSASIDTIGVHPEYRRRHIARALVRQLRLNLCALRIESVRTEIGLEDSGLLRFFQKEGFAPAARLCLERSLDPTDPDK